ncbi:MAG: hypothetical protein Kow00124_02280 [Anaerolineae bacterium]
MPVYCCYICDQNPGEKQRYGTTGLEEGEVCPVCHRPVCRHHLVTVRWRWRDDEREMGSALVCRECKRTYRHRSWDIAHRDWVT